MKKLLLIILILPLLSFAQENTPIKFTGVVDVKGTSANELKSRCLNWFAINFNDSKSILVPSSDDQLIAKPLISYVSTVFTWSERTKGTVKYTLQIQFKENKYRYIITDFIHEGNSFAQGGSIDFGMITNDVECDRPIQMSTKNWKNKVWNDIKVQIDQSILPLVESLKVSMLKENKATDNW